MSTQLLSFDQILCALRRIRLRGVFWAAIKTFSACAWAVLALLWLFSVLAHLWPDLAWSQWFSVACAVVVLTLFCAFLVRWAWRFRDLLTVAQAVEAKKSGFADGLIATVQFSKDFSNQQPPELVTALAEQTAEKLRDCQVELHPRQIYGRAWLAMIALWGACLLIPNSIFSIHFKWLEEQAAISQSKQKGPLVADLSVHCTFPEHMQREPRLWENWVGDLKLPKGARLEVQARALEPVRAAQIQMGEQKIPLKIEDERKISGEWTLTEGGSWGFAVETLRGAQLDEGNLRKIVLEPDLPPTVTLLEPANDLELDDPTQIQIAYRAADDFGLSRIQAVLSLAGDDENPTNVPQLVELKREIESDDRIDLTQMDVQHGDRLAIFVEAFDNDSVDGPKRGTSVTRFVTIRSPRQKHHALTERLRQWEEDALTALANRVEGFDAENPNPVEPTGLRAKLVTETDGLSESMRQILLELKEDALTAEEIRLALLSHLNSFDDARMAEKSSMAQGVKEAALLHQNGLVVAQLEEMIVFLEAMNARMALEDMADLTRELQDARDNLKALIEAYRQNPNDALKAKIFRDIKRLQERMEEIRKRMAEMQQKMPEEFLNLDGLKKNDLQKGLEKSRNELNSLEKMLEEDRFEEALDALDKMSQALDELSNSLQKDMQDLHDETYPELQRALSELMDQTRDLMRQQDEVSEKTEALSKKEEEAQKELLEQELKDQFDKLVELASALRLEVEQIDPDSALGFLKVALNKTQLDVDDLWNFLSQKQPSQALEAAESALEQLQDISRYWQSGDRVSKGHATRGRDIDQEIVNELLKLLKQAHQKMKQQEQGMQELSQQQQDVADRAERLQQQLGEKQKEFGEMGQISDEPLSQAQEAMGRAKKRLQQGRAGQARPAQREASQALQGMMESLKQATKPQPADRPSRSQQNRSLAHERVQIPSADDHQSPEAFRKELLDAMKAEPVEGYREQVKHYYEKIVQ